MKMLLNGEWVDRPLKMEVHNPQDNSLIDTVPQATIEDMKAAIDAAAVGAERAAHLPVHHRIAILQQTADTLTEQHEDFARTIAQEGIKTIREARKEVTRCIETIRVSAEEARRITGETIPFDQMPDTCALTKEEIYGPVTVISRFDTLDEAIHRANDVDYGLQAGIFTRDLNTAFEASKRLHCGGVMVNDSPDYRIDTMPFGGVKGSGLGREGIRFALEEMTEPKVICFNL